MAQAQGVLDGETRIISPCYVLIDLAVGSFMSWLCVDFEILGDMRKCKGMDEFQQEYT
ncbi:hypothetical protein KIN20_022624 [Parelaphostrongylus tenuis]|uniref:Uncharacterized protein n=1 Tax=Parelaphostrongylus tenuis TaxID=148309 RepID=A0AAD5QUY1_PARTN|nr:hypothetical protein KIN20_022624 [Parelaphostrongylus tenuis]